jgi:hypothetical protein
MREVAGARLATQLAAQVEPVAVGQHQVEHQRVVRAGGQAFAAGGQRAGGVDLETGSAQVVAHHGRKAGVVIDQQQA